MEILKAIRDWSEVWSLLIPLTVIFFRTRSEPSMRYIRIYIWAGLVLNLIATTLYVLHHWFLAHGGDFIIFRNNNLIYNLHSFVRVMLLGPFILQFGIYRRNIVNRLILPAYIVFVFYNFIFIAHEPPLFFNSIHFIAESIVLLTLCVSFFFSSIQDKSDTNWIKHPAFIVCAGTSIYEAVNFFTFLFFDPLSKRNPDFLKLTWTIHNLTFVILCIMLAIALFQTSKKLPAPAPAPSPNP